MLLLRLAFGCQRHENVFEAGSNRLDALELDIVRLKKLRKMCASYIRVLNNQVQCISEYGNIEHARRKAEDVERRTERFALDK